MIIGNSFGMIGSMTALPVNHLRYVNAYNWPTDKRVTGIFEHNLQYGSGACNLEFMFYNSYTGYCYNPTWVSGSDQGLSVSGLRLMPNGCYYPSSGGFDSIVWIWSPGTGIVSSGYQLIPQTGASSGGLQWQITYEIGGPSGNRLQQFTAVSAGYRCSSISLTNVIFTDENDGSSVLCTGTVSSISTGDSSSQFTITPNTDIEMDVYPSVSLRATVASHISYMTYYADHGTTIDISMIPMVDLQALCEY